MKYKICKNCGIINEINEPFCNECMESDFEIIEDIKSREELEQKADTFRSRRSKPRDVNKTVVDRKKSLKLIHPDFQISIKDSTAIGREYFGSLYLNRYPTVSRKHLEVIYRDNTWFIKDLNSTNGTYLNGVRIEPHREYEINSGDTLKLSSKVELRVDI